MVSFGTRSGPGDDSIRFQEASSGANGPSHSSVRSPFDAATWSWLPRGLVEKARLVARTGETTRRSRLARSNAEIACRPVSSVSRNRIRLPSGCQSNRVSAHDLHCGTAARGEQPARQFRRPVRGESDGISPDTTRLRGPDLLWRGPQPQLVAQQVVAWIRRAVGGGKHNAFLDLAPSEKWTRAHPAAR